MLVDSHCHLNICKEPFSVIKRAENKGIYMQTIATDLEQVPELIEIAKHSKKIFVAAGVHPCSVTNNDKVVETQKLINICAHPKITGIGETGLDYYHPGYNKNLQIRSLLNHISASQQIKLPIIIHNRNSDEECAAILTSEYKNCQFSGLIHCFSTEIGFAKSMLDIGFYISIAGIVTFKNAHILRSVVEYVPLDMLMLETDSPYLAPEPMRGKENEPAFVSFVAEKIAQIKQISDWITAGALNN